MTHSLQSEPQHVASQATVTYAASGLRLPLQRITLQGSCAAAACRSITLYVTKDRADPAAGTAATLSCVVASPVCLIQKNWENCSTAAAVQQWQRLSTATLAAAAPLAIAAAAALAGLRRRR